MLNFFFSAGTETIQKSPVSKTTATTTKKLASLCIRGTVKNYRNGWSMVVKAKVLGERLCRGI